MALTLTMTQLCRPWAWRPTWSLKRIILDTEGGGQHRTLANPAALELAWHCRTMEARLDTTMRHHRARERYSTPTDRADRFRATLKPLESLAVFQRLLTTAMPKSTEAYQTRLLRIQRQIARTAQRTVPWRAFALLRHITMTIRTTMMCSNMDRTEMFRMGARHQ